MRRTEKKHLHVYFSEQAELRISTPKIYSPNTTEEGLVNGLGPAEVRGTFSDLKPGSNCHDS